MARIGRDRDTILSKAIIAAKAFNKIFVAWRMPSGDWCFQPYPISLADEYNAVRYILPHGEVTKLS